MRRSDKKAVGMLRQFFRPVFPEGHSRKSVYSRIWKIYYPAAMEFALLQLVSMFDQIQVGGIGPAALAAVGIANQVKMVLVTVFISVNIGVTALVAHSSGAGEHERIPKAVSHGLLLTFIMALTVSVIGFFTGDLLLVPFGLSDDPVTMQYASQYLRIILAGFIPLALTTTYTAALRAIGNTKAPLFYNYIANVLNILFNWILINGKLGFPALGVRGAAIATVIGQLVAFLIGTYICFRRGNALGMNFTRPVWNFERTTAKDTLRIGFPAMLEQVFRRLGITAYTAVVSALGTNLYATHVICINIQQLTGMNGQSSSVAATTLAGQSLGAKRPDLSELYTTSCVKMCLWISFVLMAVYTFFGTFLIGLYSDVPEIISTGIVLLRIISVMQPFTAFQYVYSGALRGMGDTKHVAICSMAGQMIGRPVLAFLAVRVFGLGIYGAWYAHCFSEIVYAVLLIMRFRSGKWKSGWRKAGKEIIVEETAQTV
ncbi:MAG: MATE family efflux transporter [Spirochaetales bacterium]|nr:MATE family efflux transporter [Spirochaetales bacterium]